MTAACPPASDVPGTLPEIPSDLATATDWPRSGTEPGARKETWRLDGWRVDAMCVLFTLTT
jgi:hypothetical protein